MDGGSSFSVGKVFLGEGSVLDTVKQRKELAGVKGNFGHLWIGIAVLSMWKGLHRSKGVL